MLISRMSRVLTRTFGALLVCVSSVGVVSAAGDEEQPRNPDAAPGMHLATEHEPIDLDIRPSVSRYDVPFISPRRMILGSNGELLVADWGAGAIIQIDPDGSPSLLASGLDEPAGLALDGYGNLYVAQHAGGSPASGSIVKIAPDGMHSLIASGLGGPTDLAFGPDGALYVAAFQDDAIHRVTTSGLVERLAIEIPGPAAVAFDSTGNLYVASSTEGSLHRIDSMGGATIVARGLNGPSDLALDSEEHLIVANHGGSSLSYVDGSGRVRLFAQVPRGTIAHLFDRDDNLVLANWERHDLMKVTLSVTIPCPHCGREVPVRFRPHSGEVRSPKDEG